MDVSWRASLLQKFNTVYHNIARKITHTYGYCPKLNKSARYNACKLAYLYPPSLKMIRPSNMAFHNLCKLHTIPSFIKKYLGLGLNFCPNPRTSSSLYDIDTERLRDDYHRYIFFRAGDIENDFEKPTLYVPTNGLGGPIEDHYHDRLATFVRALDRNFQKKNGLINLTYRQIQAQKWLLQHPEITVLSADKNLGPITMDRADYIRYAYNDHLHDQTTYRQLLGLEGTFAITDVQTRIFNFCEIWHNKNVLTDMDVKWITKHTTVNPSYFYLLAKIHKQPLKTRPIVSYSGSVCYGLAKWLDVELKKLLPHLPYVAPSSVSIVTDLREQTFPSSTLLLTMDATAMYTNIHLGHALPVLTHFLYETEKGRKIVQESEICPAALLTAIEIVMNNNIFSFGDTTWLQTAGTAMGTPPAPTWATIYFCIWEIVVIPEFPELVYYRRYIDDGFGAWVPNPLVDNAARLTLFHQRLQSFGIEHEFFLSNPDLRPLQWTFSALAPTAVFLDLFISIDNGRITTKIYEKDLNLYLYIPPHSCHSKGVIKGVIFGMVHRAKTLCTHSKDRILFLSRCYHRLIARGYTSAMIRPIFKNAIRALLDPPMDPPLQHNTDTRLPPSAPAAKTRPLFLHVPVNPADPPASKLQKLFELHLRTDATEPGNFRTCKNLVVCYHGQTSLKNILAPRKGRFGDDFSISEAFQALALE